LFCKIFAFFSLPFYSGGFPASINGALQRSPREQAQRASDLPETPSAPFEWVGMESNPVQTFPFPKITAFRHGGGYTGQAIYFLDCGW